MESVQQHSSDTTTELEHFPIVEKPPQDMHGGIGVEGLAPGSGG